MADEGRNRYPDAMHWMTDGYGDYVRHYLRAMASAPELAPEEQNHLLRSSSVIRSIHYDSSGIVYSKFDSTSVETFKMGAWIPKSVSGGRMQWDPAKKILTVRSTGGTVKISR